jgi:hypothetical protein
MVVKIIMSRIAVPVGIGLVFIIFLLFVWFYMYICEKLSSVSE